MGVTKHMRNSGQLTNHQSQIKCSMYNMRFSGRYSLRERGHIFCYMFTKIWINRPPPSSGQCTVSLCPFLTTWCSVVINTYGVGCAQENFTTVHYCYLLGMSVGSFLNLSELYTRNLTKETQFLVLNILGFLYIYQKKTLIVSLELKLNICIF
jgi:hypothetical protein